MPSNHLILCHPLFLLSSIFPSIRVFSSESVLPSEYSGLISFRIDCLISLQSRGFSRIFSNSTVQKHKFFSAQLSLWSNSHIHTWLLVKMTFRFMWTGKYSILSWSVQFSSIAQWCLTLSDPMDYSMPSLPVHYQFPGPAQTHVHQIGDAIQTAHPLSSPSPAFNLSQH